jgi:hypothetical protein
MLMPQFRAGIEGEFPTPPQETAIAVENVQQANPAGCGPAIDAGCRHQPNEPAAVTAEGGDQR